METDDVVTVPRHLVTEVLTRAHAITEIVMDMPEKIGPEIGAKTQDLVGFALWGFESPLSHQ